MPAFLQWNRGKKSVVLDLKTEEGWQRARSLAATCDIVIENFRPGVAERLGSDYERLSAENRRLICFAISAFGQRGKYRGYEGYEGRGGVAVPRREGAYTAESMYGRITLDMRQTRA